MSVVVGLDKIVGTACLQVEYRLILAPLSNPSSRMGATLLLYEIFFTVTAGGMSANIATFEQYIKQSEESQGTVVTILRQGWLLKRSSNMRREWKRRFFVLDSLGMLYYYSNKVLGPVFMLILCCSCCHCCCGCRCCC